MISDDRVYRGVRIIQGLVNPHKEGRIVIHVRAATEAHPGWMRDLHAAFDWLSMEAFHYQKAGRAVEVGRNVGALPSEAARPEDLDGVEPVPFPHAGRKMSKAIQKKVYELSQKGYNGSQIGKALGYDPSTIRKYQREMGFA